MDRRATSNRAFAQTRPKLAAYTHILPLGSERNSPPPTIDDMVAQTPQTCDGPLVAGEDLKSAAPILFVRDVSASAAFFREKLG